MSSSVAFVVLAHSDPRQVRRLLGTLRGADVFLHCDRRVPDRVVRAMLPTMSPEPIAVERIRTRPGSWSLVEAELQGLRAALARSRGEHIVVMSGACYPLTSMDDLKAYLAGRQGQSLFELNRIPYAGWSTRRHPDGGMWRFTRRFLTHGDDVLTVMRGIPLSIGHRRVPAGLELYGGSHWKIYSRRHASALLRVLADQPEQRSYWRRTYVPEETCATSVLRSPALVGDLASSVRDEHPWFIRWPAPRTRHPPMLTSDDFDQIAAAQRGMGPARPQPGLQTDASAPTPPHRKLFARKFGSDASALLDRIDGELRHDDGCGPGA